jgi:hypothetical protein
VTDFAVRAFGSVGGVRTRHRIRHEAVRYVHRGLHPGESKHQGRGPLTIASFGCPPRAVENVRRPATHRWPAIALHRSVRTDVCGGRPRTEEARVP